MQRRLLQGLLFVGLAMMPFVPARGGDLIPRADERFATADVQEIPDFRRHVLPLLGRLGCNGRSCHGSFQGQGDLRLSLFGYDFEADHQALVSGDSPLADAKQPAQSPLLYKPTHGDEHGGGQRMESGSWSALLMRRWIEAGARGVKPNDPQFVSIEIVPSEIVISAAGAQTPLRVLARWSDGSVEDVTPLCRYQTNDESIAEVDAEGVVTGKGRGDTHVVAFYDSGVAVSQVLLPTSDQVGDQYPSVATPTKVDEFVVAKLRKLGIVPSEVCSDGEYLRRVSLDLTGTLPTPAEIETFIADASPDKRANKIDELLSRPTYVARWTTKLCDITGNSTRQFEDNAPPDEYAMHWYEWIARRVRDNVPYDELVAGIALGRSRRPGETYQDYVDEESAYYREDSPQDFAARDTMPYYWAKRTSRTPEERALNFSYAFLGLRIECAQCHKHPFDRWTQADFQGFKAFFAPIGYGVPPDDKKLYQAMLDRLGDKGNQSQRVRARLVRAQRGEVVPWLEVFVAPPGSRVENGRIVDADQAIVPRLLGGDVIDPEDRNDPRQALMDWMRRKDNPYFVRVFVNRVWAEYFGVGIINPPDDMNQANPPSNAPLLDYLASGFIDQGFDMKWLHREIVASQTYQRSLRSNGTNRLDEKNFSRAVVRRLPAELLLDAIDQATANSTDLALAATNVENRAIGPQGGAFVGRRRHNDYAATVFGRSPRDVNCDCSSSNEPNLLQAIYLKNDSEVIQALQAKHGWLHEIRQQMVQSKREGKAIDTSDLIEQAYLRTLSRRPTAAEIQRCAAHLERVGDASEGLYEVLWALLNTREFMTNH